jgi:cytochrome c-type biogenesis protein CcmF
VRSRAAGDLYLNLMAFEQDGSGATIRMIVEPLVPWIWAGGYIVVLGALISLWPNRRRQPAAVRQRAVAGEGAPSLPPRAPAPARAIVTGDAT